MDVGYCFAAGLGRAACSLKARGETRPGASGWFSTSMLFLLKRTVAGGVLGAGLLALVGLMLRHWLGGPPLMESPIQLAMGVGVVLVVLACDVTLHGLFCWLFGDSYKHRHRELAQVFRDQSMPAMLTGAAMAGLGEELLFRGLSSDPVFLAISAVVFGLLHHIRRSLWPFTIWAMFQGVLFGVALHLTGVLCVPMVAHFLHDLTGFAIFRYLNRRAPIV